MSLKKSRSAAELSPRHTPAAATHGASVRSVLRLEGASRPKAGRRGLGEENAMANELYPRERAVFVHFVNIYWFPWKAIESSAPPLKPSDALLGGVSWRWILRNTRGWDLPET